jgi:hypothetical protein
MKLLGHRPLDWVGKVLADAACWLHRVIPGALPLQHLHATKVLVVQVVAAAAAAAAAGKRQ